MAQPDEILESDLDAQLRGLFQEAERDLGTRAAAAAERQKAEAPEPAKPAPPQPPAEGASKVPQMSLPQILQPVVRGLEAVSRTAHESHTMLKKMDAEATAAAQARQELPQIVADLRAVIDGKSGVSQSMFAALHEELKSYKDGFLLDAVHRPIIRDLIALYDDTAEIQRQIVAAVAQAAEAGVNEGVPPIMASLHTIEMNVEHHIEFLAEVLNRLEVTRMDASTGKLDKTTQRAVAVEPTEDPDQDSTIVRTTKRGFLWKGRVFRPEEVVIRRWKEGFFAALKPEQP